MTGCFRRGGLTPLAETWISFAELDMSVSPCHIGWISFVTVMTEGSEGM
jgi:hypothetical protein